MFEFSFISLLTQEKTTSLKFILCFQRTREEVRDILEFPFNQNLGGFPLFCQKIIIAETLSSHK